MKHKRPSIIVSAIFVIRLPLSLLVLSLIGLLRSLGTYREHGHNPG